MNTTTVTRLNKQLTDFNKSTQMADLKISVVDKNILHWKGYLKGPADTVYQGGLYQIDIVFPPQYPYKPPKMKFDTKIWHPNISSQTGAICLDILKNQWSPALCVRTAMLSLQALLCQPVPDDPQDAVVAQQYKAQYKLYQKTAKQWVQKFASPQTMQAKVKKLIEMGFDRQKVVRALQNNGYDEDKAIDDIFASV